MNLNKISLLALAINILITPLALGMEDTLSSAMRRRYACLREIAIKLDALANSQDINPKKYKGEKDKLLRPLEPEEKDLIEQALLLARDSSRPVGRLLKFLNTEERLRSKMKMHLKDYKETQQKTQEQEAFISKRQESSEQLPWEMIAPQLTHEPAPATYKRVPKSYWLL